MSKQFNVHVQVNVTVCVYNVTADNSVHAARLAARRVALSNSSPIAPVIGTQIASFDVFETETISLRKDRLSAGFGVVESKETTGKNFPSFERVCDFISHQDLAAVERTFNNVITNHNATFLDVVLEDFSNIEYEDRSKYASTVRGIFRLRSRTVKGNEIIDVFKLFHSVVEADKVIEDAQRDSVAGDGK